MASQPAQTRGSSDILIRTAHAIDVWLESNRNLYLAVACALCFLANIGYAHYRVVTADECLQLIIARQPTLRGIWESLSVGVQVDPPVLDATIHYLFRIFGDHLILARLPSVLGFCLMCLCLSLIVWRYAGGIYGATAFFMPFATSVRSWASLMRPEALRLGFSALALLCWDRLQAADERHIWRWRVALILSLAMSFSTHFFNVTILFPLALGELAKWQIRKRIDWPTILCIAAGFIPWILWSPILWSATHTFMAHALPLPAFKTLYEFYGDLLFALPWVGAVVLILFAEAYLGPAKDSDASPAYPVSQAGYFRTMMVFCGGCLLLPVCGALITVWRSGLYWPRMSLIAVFGLVIGLPLLLTLAGARKIVGLALLATMAANAAMVTAQGAMRLRGRQTPYPAVAELRKLIPEPHPDIVFVDNYDFGPFLEANRDDPENSLLYLFDTEKQLAARNSDTPDVAARITQGRGPARILPFDSYVATHPHFYLLSTVDIVTADEWQFKYLFAQMHARMMWLGNVRGWDLYSVDLK
jgi:hypothetical protein